jgi:hypothetical protein
VTPTEEIRQTWTTEGDLAGEIAAPTLSGPTPSGRANTWTRRRVNVARF